MDKYTLIDALGIKLINEEITIDTYDRAIEKILEIPTFSRPIIKATGKTFRKAVTTPTFDRPIMKAVKSKVSETKLEDDKINYPSILHKKLKKTRKKFVKHVKNSKFAMSWEGENKDLQEAELPKEDVFAKMRRLERMMEEVEKNEQVAYEKLMKQDIEYKEKIKAGAALHDAEVQNLKKEIEDTSKKVKYFKQLKIKLISILKKSRDFLQRHGKKFIPKTTKGKVALGVGLAATTIGGTYASHKIGGRKPEDRKPLKEIDSYLNEMIQESEFIDEYISQHLSETFRDKRKVAKEGLTIIDETPFGPPLKVAAKNLHAQKYFLDNLKKINTILIQSPRLEPKRLERLKSARERIKKALMKFQQDLIK